MSLHEVELIGAACEPPETREIANLMVFRSVATRG